MYKTVSVATYEILKAQGLKKGSTVEILTTWPSHGNGFHAHWNNFMTKCVGMTGEVMDIREDFIGEAKHHQYQVQVRVKYSEGGKDMVETWWYPVTVLAFVSNNKRTMRLTADYEAVVDVEAQTVTVGCQTIPFSKIDELLGLMAE